MQLVKEEKNYIFLAIFIILYPFLFKPGDIFYVTITKYMYLTIFIFAIWILFILRWIRDKQLPLMFKTRAELLGIIFLLIVFVATIFSEDFMTSFHGSKDKYQGFITWLSYLSLFIFTYHLVPTNKQIKISKLLVYASFFCGIYGILQHFSVLQMKPKYIKIWGFFDNSNHFGTYLVIMILLGMTHYLLSKKTVETVIQWLIICTLFITMLYTMSRGSWLALLFGVSLLTFFILLKRRELWKRWGLLFGSFIILTFIVNMTENTSVITQSSRVVSDVSAIMQKEENIEKAGSSRWGIWQRTIEIIKENYIIGTGPSTFPLVFPHTENEIKYRQTFDNSHNDYLEIAMSMGVPALIVYLAFMLTILKEGLNTVLKLKGDEQLFLFGLMVVIVGYLTKVLFNISVTPVAPFFWVLLGICYAYSMKVKVGEGRT